MRKSIFIIAALFAATFANAQITLEHTFEYDIHAPHEVINTKSQTTMGDIFAYIDSGTLVCIDALTYDEIARIAIPGAKRYELIAKNIYSTDGLIGFIVKSENGTSVYNQNGLKLADLGKCDAHEIIHLSSGYKLVAYLEEEVYNGENNYTYKCTTEIYSLPGNGEAQAVSTPSSPKRNARKYLRNDQVLIENTDHTYTVTGQEVK